MSDNSRTIYGLPSNTTFCDVWGTETAFLTDYKANKIYTYNESERLSDNYAKTLYWLLYSKYGNNSIASRDTTRFKYNVWAIIFQYGPTWIAELDLQNKARSATLDQIAAGSKVIQNHAYNPGTAPGTSSTTELTAINDQVATSYNKNYAEAIAAKDEIIRRDVTNAFLEKFRHLFAAVAAPVYQIAFPVEEDE